ncbi:MAG: hypothetical protein KOO62_12045 [candidate division Zixibacteria bacterium]|nr:hypothetical protein [candidate division Zixibacteria bacterium]
MWFSKAKTLSLLFVVFLPMTLFAGRVKHETLDVPPEGAKRVVVSVEFGAGEIWLTSGDIDNVVEMEVTYDTRNIDFDHEYEVRNDVGDLILESNHRDNKNIDTEDHKWDMTISQNYPLRFDLDIGACEAEMDLGGLQLEEFSLEVGAASAEIDFSSPNPIRLEEIRIEAGAASLEMRQIGNANFETLDFSGGVGSFDLDLRGKYTGESKVTIEVGLGSMDIILPRGLPVRVITEGANWLSSIDFHHDRLDEVDDDVYESPDFEDAEIRLILDVEVGLGSIDLYWKR